MNGENPISPSTIVGSFLGIFWGLWLQRFSQAIFESTAVRPWAEDLDLFVTKWMFAAAFLAVVLSVIGLMWIFATLAEQRETILQLGLNGSPVADEGIILLRNFRRSIGIFLVISLFVIALPFASFEVVPEIWTGS